MTTESQPQKVLAEARKLAISRIEEAVLAERERCAKIADVRAKEFSSQGESDILGRIIAAAIRSGK